jgi:hypothetical protein
MQTSIWMPSGGYIAADNIDAATAGLKNYSKHLKPLGMLLAAAALAPS